MKNLWFIYTISNQLFTDLNYYYLMCHNILDLLRLIMTSQNRNGDFPPIPHLKIKAARKHAGMTQQQLADALGVSRPAVSLWESNDPIVRNEPTRTRLRKLSVVTGAPLHWLMDDADNAMPENFQKVIKDIEAINHRLGNLTPEQLSAVRNIIDSYWIS